MLRKRPILIDAALLTACVFLFIFLVSVLFPIKLKVFHPIKDAFSDFDYTDFYFSKLKKEPEVSADIVVVNIGHLNRAEIAHQIEVIHSFQPKVVGLDAIFTEPKDSLSDALLADVLRQHAVVGISKMHEHDMIQSLDRFQFRTSGYANLYGEEEPTKVIRSFAAMTKVDTSWIKSFTAQMLVNAHPDGEVTLPHGEQKINYRSSESFITLQPYELFDPEFDGSLLNGKFVLMGFTGSPENPYDVEDQHFTPMNVKMAGKSLPDMKGIYIHASILQSLIHQDYIRMGSPVVEWFLTILFTFLTAWLIIHYYVHRARWFHLMSKLVQLFAGVIFLFVSIWIMHVYHVKLNFTMLFVALVLCADLVYFYDPIAKWLHKRNWFHSEILKH
ncbi:MAG: CHASE2 domain-containing protein [Bacteroidetes bacterium]|nr:CHASE2 domain-containing protein [Bacteroidota bacterium]